MIVTYHDLAQKTFILTGATRGIGKVIALELAKQKAHIVFNHRNKPEDAQKLIAEIEALGGKGTALDFDVTQTEKMLAEIEKIGKSMPIHGLINNAGISRDGLSLRVKPQDIDDVLSVNLKATMILTNATLRYMMKSGKASIINMSSIVGLMGNTGQSVYAASKAGVIGFTKSIAKEYASKNVRSNAICPGFIATEMTHELNQETQKNYLTNIPLARFGEASEVANLVCFLLSDASSYITGEVIKIDGGLYI